MIPAIFLARAWGLYLTIISLALLLNRKSLQWLLKIYETERAVFLSGVASLMMGIFTLSAHNVWVSDWRLIITVFGWFALFKGIVRTFFSGWVVKNATRWVKVFMDKSLIFLLLLLVLALGVYLSYVGFAS